MIYRWIDSYIDDFETLQFLIIFQGLVSAKSQANKGQANVFLLGGQLNTFQHVFSLQPTHL